MNKFNVNKLIKLYKTFLSEREKINLEEDKKDIDIEEKQSEMYTPYINNRVYTTYYVNCCSQNIIRDLKKFKEDIMSSDNYIYLNIKYLTEIINDEILCNYLKYINDIELYRDYKSIIMEPKVNTKSDLDYGLIYCHSSSYTIKIGKQILDELINFIDDESTVISPMFFSKDNYDINCILYNENPEVIKKLKDKIQLITDTIKHCVYKHDYMFIDNVIDKAKKKISDYEISSKKIISNDKSKIYMKYEFPSDSLPSLYFLYSTEYQNKVMSYLKLKYSDKLILDSIVTYVDPYDIIKIDSHFVKEVVKFINSMYVYNVSEVKIQIDYTGLNDEDKERFFLNDDIEYYFEHLIDSYKMKLDKIAEDICELNV